MSSYKQPADWTTSWENYLGPCEAVLHDTGLARGTVIDHTTDYDQPLMLIEFEGQPLWVHPRYVSPKVQP